METKQKQENVQTNQSKNKKKNKNKEKKRLMSLFRGPKVEHNFYYKPNEEEVKSIKQSLIEIMNENQCLKLHKQPKKNSDNNDNKSDPNLKLTNNLVFGLNAIIRAIEKKTIIGVIITDPLAIQLMDNIIELCSDNKIPCLSVDSFEEMKTYLNISSLTGMGFKPNTSSSESILHKSYQNFLNIVNKNCVINEDVGDTHKQTQSLVKDISKEVTLGAKKGEESFDKNLYDILYTKDSGDNYSELVENHMKKVNDSFNDMNVIATQQSFLPFSDNSEVYFPPRETQNEIIAKIEVIVDEEIKSCDKSFAESLMEVSVENVHKVMKRKSCQQNRTNSTLSYREPEIVRLEPSTNKIQKRQQRKVAKKTKSKSNISK